MSATYENFTIDSAKVIQSALISKSAPQYVKIEAVKIITNSRKYNSSWSRPMYEIETPNGVYIAEPGEFNCPHIMEHIGSTILVWAEPSVGAKGWKWLRFPYENSTYVLKDVLKLDLPKTECIVYRLTIDNFFYIGFTTKTPEERLSQHLATAKMRHSDHTQKVHQALVRGKDVKIEVLGRFENEIMALMAEIVFIRLYQPSAAVSLNTSKGGEGKDFFIIPPKTDTFDPSQFWVKDVYARLRI